MTAYILNLFDLLCTLYAVRLGAEELNPFMQDIPYMVFYKVVIIGLLLWWLTRRPEPIAVRGVKVCTAVYALLALHHVAALLFYI